MDPAIAGLLEHCLWVAAAVAVSLRFLGKRADTRRFLAIESGLDNHQIDLKASKLATEACAELTLNLRKRLDKLEQPVARKQVF